MGRLWRRVSRVALWAGMLWLGAAAAATPLTRGDWTSVLERARGETVYFNAWGGEPGMNDYIAWVDEQVEQRFGVTVRHVRLADTADAVTRVIAETAAGNTDSGSADLIWIDGENFAALKAHDLLYGPWAEALPNYRYVDTGEPAVTNDAGVPVDGLESPWNLAARVIFIQDTAYVDRPPRTADALLRWAREHPGEFTYPLIPNFLGTQFLAQLLHELNPAPDKVTRPLSELPPETFDTVTRPLWKYLDGLHQYVWRGGRTFPANGAAARGLLADGEILITVANNSAAVSAGIASGRLPDSVRAYVFDRGTTRSADFVAIPSNAPHKAGAMVVANFLLSPEAQARKLANSVWGSSTVLDLDRLPPKARERFKSIDYGPATIRPGEFGPALPEIHPSWGVALEEEWLKRYRVAQ